MENFQQKATREWTEIVLQTVFVATINFSVQAIIVAVRFELSCESQSLGKTMHEKFQTIS